MVLVILSVTLSIRCCYFLFKLHLLVFLVLKDIWDVWELGFPVKLTSLKHAGGCREFMYVSLVALATKDVCRLAFTCIDYVLQIVHYYH